MKGAITINEELKVELTCEELETAAGGTGNSNDDLTPGTVLRIVTTEVFGKYVKMPEVKLDTGWRKKCTLNAGVNRDLIVPGARVKVRRMHDNYVIWELLD